VIERLGSLDTGLHRQLTEQKSLCIYYDPEQLHDMYSWGLYSINDRFVAWGTDGIIARLVYIAFKLATFPWRAVRAHDMAAARVAQNSVLAQTKRWLEAHNFPAPLCESFSEEVHTV
jgi:hypothetical protein